MTQEASPWNEREGEDRVVDIRRSAQSRSVAAMEAGQEALGRGAWQEARTCFESALQEEETPEALEGLGMATWWLEDDAAVFDARRRAYRLYRDRDDRIGAARVAISLIWDHFFQGEYPIANGWVQRARRLLDGLEECPELGWLAVTEAYIALMADYDPAAAQRISAQAVSLGGSLGDIDLEMLALALEGFALVSQGQVSEGMRQLDESTTAAMAGEMSEIDAAGLACCCLIYACEQVRDYGRAAQWCKKLKEFSERWSFRTMFSFCRIHYAGTLVWRGEWAEAEAELEAAIRAFEATRPGMAAEGLLRLAELRCRQGRFDEAAMLLERTESHPFRTLTGNLPIIGRAALALAQDDAESAAELVERFLRAITDGDRLQRAAGLDLLVRVRLALGNRALAEEALVELRTVANTVGTEAMRGSARFAEGLIAAAAGDHESARRHFEDAADLFARSSAPFETAHSRLELARSLFALDRPDAAELQARNALEAFEGLGAAAEADRATELLREMRIAAHEQAGDEPNLAGLSRREVEVLHLVAQGLSDKEIAARLVLSRHTVHRHVHSILTKLDLPSRTAAAAYATRHGLL